MSGRIRTIKPEWLEDELLASEKDHVRVLSVALILMADDHGRGRASVDFVAGEAWRYDRSPEALTKVREGLTRLSRIRFVRLYKVDGQSYFEIRSWAKHQKVQHVGKGRVPEPPEENPNAIEESGSAHETLTKVPETLTNIPESLTPDLRPHTSDHDHGTSVPVATASPPSGPVRDVWDAYMAGWRAKVGKGAEPQLTDKRKALIKARLREHPVEIVTSAAAGIWQSSWHLEDVRRRISIEIVMRDAAHVERLSSEDASPRSSSMPANDEARDSMGHTRAQRIAATQAAIDESDRELLGRASH